MKMRKDRREKQWVLLVVLFLATYIFAMAFARRSSGGGPMLENRQRGRKESSGVVGGISSSSSSSGGGGGGSSGSRSSKSSTQRNSNSRLLLRSETTELMDNSMRSRKLLLEKQQQQHENIVMTMTTSATSTAGRMMMLSSGGSGRVGGSSNSNANANSRKRSFPHRPASVNSILRLDPSSSLWDHSTSVCHTVPGLTREQMELCFRSPDATKVAIQGLTLATEECAHQMQKHRWNCSSLQGSPNPHNTQMFQKGYRESAFGHAIASAGVAYSVAKACSQGKLLSCGCGFQYDDQVNYIPSKDADYSFDESNESVLKRNSGSGSVSSWKWSGCSHNMDYGIRFAKTMLDLREKSQDLPSRINLHNNKVGRLAVSANMEVRCKCHGLSGSCELRTCWRSAPDFRRVGTVLKNKFRRAIMIDQSDLGNRPLNRIQKINKQRRKRRDRQIQKKNANIDLWYYERSPTYCESNNDFSIPGTSGRRCNKTGGRTDTGSCSTLCCGRGYNTIRQVYTQRCQCQFLWCCQVICQNCTVDEWVTVCK